MTARDMTAAIEVLQAEELKVIREIANLQIARDSYRDAISALEGQGATAGPRSIDEAFDGPPHGRPPGWKPRPIADNPQA